VLSEALGDLLISAAAIALSPVPIVAAVVVLGGPRARTAGPALLAGWLLGLAAVTALVLVVFSNGDDPDSTTADAIHWVELAVGLLFLVLAARKWRSRPAADAPPAPPPAWMASVQDVAAGRALLLGAGLAAANPKNLALIVTAGGSISEAGLDAADTVLAGVVFVLLASATVLLPVVGSLVAPARAVRPLAAVRAFMDANGTTIVIVILLLLGAKLVGNGLGALWT
jgi:threonine/homoserine/homoserine lactone efflux protein